MAQIMVSLIEDQSTEPRSLTRSGSPLVFIHGLAGSPQTTWRYMSACFVADADLASFDLAYYKFPTKLLRLPFAAPPPGLRSLADGLTTFLDEEYDEKSPVTLVAHSLGGLIARQMIVNEMRAGRECRVSKLALIAVPNSGSTLASVGSLVSFPHRQLKRLSRDDEALRSLNADWEQLKVEEKVRVRYIIGGCDRAVPQNSAVPYMDRTLNTSVIIEADHRSIIAPIDNADIRFRTLRRFVLEGSESLQSVTSAGRLMAANSDKRADPLFDAYTPVDSIFYIERAVDQVILQALGTGNVWLAGGSGVGKTAALRHAVFHNGWSLKHVNLAGYEVASSSELFRAMAQEIATIANLDKAMPQERDIGQCCIHIKAALRSFSDDVTVAVVVEELPISPDNMIKFVEEVSILLESIALDSDLHGRVVFAFSSLAQPRTMSSKAREKLQLLNIGTWSRVESRRLTDLLAATLRPTLVDSEKDDIVESASGSPRFIKRLFRTWRSGTDNGASIGELLTQMRLEEV